MRILVTAVEGIGHLLPVVPLAWALRSAGHTVLVATTGTNLSLDVGLPMRDHSPGTGRDALWGGAFAAVPRLFAHSYPQQPDLADRMRRGAEPVDVRMGSALFAGYADLVADEIVEVADGYHPDLLVHDALGPAGAVAAAALGVPAVRHELGPGPTAQMTDHMMRHLAPTFARHGVAGPVRAAAVIDMSPPSMRALPGGWPMRFVSHAGGTVTPLPQPASRPRVVVTFGTVSPRTHGLGPVQRIVAAAAAVDAEFVLALGDAHPDGLGPLPPNVRAVGWTPLPALLASASAVVHHGGAGTTFAALEAGLPQLLLPDGADRYANAGPVGARGAGLVATAEDVDAPLLRRLLTDDRLAASARAVRQEMAAMPSPATVVDRLTGLAATTPAPTSKDS